MASKSPSLPLSLFLFSLTIQIVNSQISVGGNIFDSLDKLGCSQFKSIILAAKMEATYKAAALPLTLFVFNDTTFNSMPPSRSGNLYENTERGPQKYVQSFTLSSLVETSRFRSGEAFVSMYDDRGYLFLNEVKMLSGNVASGNPGVTRYFVNGAMVVTGNIKAGQHIIHIIDRVLDMPLDANAVSYANYKNPKRTQFKFFKDLMDPLKNSDINNDQEFNYFKQVQQPLQLGQVTFFLPTDAAMEKITDAKLGELQSNPQKLLRIVTLHIIPNQVLFTSLVNHNSLETSQMKSGNLVFRKHFDKEAVYITGSLKGEATVTARLSPANVTIRNGVVHHVDQLLGFVYKTAIEEIQTDDDSNNFASFVNSARVDLKANLAASNGVTLFVPTNNAVHAINNVYENYISNLTLINRVLQLSMLKQGTNVVELTRYNYGYNSMVTLESMYNGDMIKVYSEGNDTWVEGGYVRARVIKPDIGVTNGIVHLIDAVFGIPTRDIVYTMFCHDWLESTYKELLYVELDEYMKDPSLKKNQQCSFRSGEIGSSAGVINRFEQDKLCGDSYYRCQFTFFVPNGTAVDNFRRRLDGQDVVSQPKRWRWLLRRLMTRRKVMYLDKLALGSQHRYIADNGEEVLVYVTGRSQFSSGQRRVILRFDNAQAEVVRSDIGTTNGVIHIINDILFDQDDLYRDISIAAATQASLTTLLTMTILSVVFVKYLI